MKFLKYFILLTAALIPNAAGAQTMKYVTYFPVPHAYYSVLAVSEFALLSTRGMGDVALPEAYSSGYVFVGSEDVNPNAALKAPLQSHNLILRAEAPVSQPSTIPNLFVGRGADSIAAPTTGTGIFSTAGNFEAKSVPTGFAPSLFVYDTLTLRSLMWGTSITSMKGGFGKSSTGADDWSICNSATKFVWKTMKITGTNQYRTYLACE